MKNQEIDKISLNGAMGEGGGALLRTALALSSITRQAVRIHNVRGATRKPGITAEDLALIEALRVSTDAIVEGDTMRSDRLEFCPRRLPKAVNYRLDVSSFQEGRVSGCAPILASSLAPILARAGAYSSLTICGETHANNALSFDSFEKSTMDAWRCQGLYTYTTLKQSGFGFGARGELQVEIEPSALEPMDWTSRGALIATGAVITWSEISPTDVARCLELAAAKLVDSPVTVQFDNFEVHGKEPGLSVCFWARFEHGSGSGTAVLQRGMNVSSAVEMAFASFENWFRSDATVDPFLADQLLIPGVLAIGKTTYTTPIVTRRLVTMVGVVKRFLPIKVTVSGVEGQKGRVIIDRQS